MRVKELLLIEEVEYTGIWFLPFTEDKELHGTVKYTQSDIILTLTGSFDNPSLDPKLRKIFETSKHETIPIILGLSRETEKITLERCVFIRRSSSFNGLETIQYRVDKMFVGEHFNQIQDIQFLSIGIHYAYIHEWFAQSGIMSNHKINGFVLTFKIPKPITRKLDKEFSIRFSRSVKYPTSSPWEYSVSMEQKLFFSVECNTQKHYSEFIKIHKIFQDFFTLAFSEPTFPLMIHAIADSDKLKKHVMIFQISSFVRKTPKVIYSDAMLFHFGKFPHTSISNIKKWYLNHKKIQDVVSLYFSSLYNPNQYLEVDFQTTIQALEAYHRIKFKKQNTIPSSKYTHMIKRIEHSIKNKNDKSWFKSKSKLHVLNEPSLPSRLGDLLDAFPQTLDSIKEKTDFIEKVSATRNYFAHHTESLKKRANVDSDLFMLTKKLGVLMEAIFLKESGFKGKRLDMLIIKNRDAKTQYSPIKF